MTTVNSSREIKMNILGYACPSLSLSLSNAPVLLPNFYFCLFDQMPTLNVSDLLLTLYIITMAHILGISFVTTVNA